VFGLYRGPFISQGGLGYNDFLHDQVVRGYAVDQAVIPRSGKYVAVMEVRYTGGGSIFTTRRCFTLKSFSYACVAPTIKVEYKQDLEYAAVPCRFELTAYDANDKEVVKTFDYDPGPQVKKGGVAGVMSDAVEQFEAAKFIRIRVLGREGDEMSGPTKAYLDNVKYVQYDDTVSGLLACPGFGAI
jgi:hypothetical protein